jgi:hypothetical protein
MKYNEIPCLLRTIALSDLQDHISKFLGNISFLVAFI